MGENNCTCTLPPELLLLFILSLLCFRFLEQRKNHRGIKMPGSEITFLVEDLEAVLEMNRLLEEENKQLKQDVSRLKAQVTAFKAHDTERKSLLWKKIQYNATPDPPEKARRPIAPPPEPPRTPEQKKPIGGGGPAPPPPPLPSRSLVGGKAVKRAPEVIEFYRYLTRRSAQLEKKGSSIGIPAEASSNRNMIGEIENRSTYLSAIKSDVETQGELIKRLMNEIESASFTEISGVEAFVKWLDSELSCLVDERAVLKHFARWPERKADAMREAACSYRDLRALESEILGFRDDQKQSLSQILGKIQTLQDRLERSVGNVERTREGTSKRYRELQIPWEWMLDSGFIGKIKLSSLKLAMEYMKKIAKEVQSPKCSKMDELILQGVRFGYRVHQFAGGFDMEAMKVFEELKQLHAINQS